ncbi:MAG: low molecular weight protein arginine phosphatase [Halobacteriota archaeon]|nr:low molecular weight protein arginine phosphatase [Halobacteriota archaeon]
MNGEERSYKSILFVCDANTCRSPMAEVILKELLSKHEGEGAAQIKVRSGGIGSHARDNSLFSLDAKLTVKEKGYIPSEEIFSRDLSIHTDMIEDSDLILTMTEVQKERVLKLQVAKDKEVETLKEFVGENGDIADPRGGDDEIYDKCFNEIKSCLDKLVEKILP